MENQVILPSSNQKKPKDWSWIPSVILALVLISVTIVVAFFRQPIVDRYNYYTYQPTESVEEIVNLASLSDNGKFYFYISKPEINDAQSFNQNCTKLEATSVILGCYVNDRIYIFDVNNSETLSGVKTVTAAHEMLHSVWDRLPESEKDRLKPLLLAAYERLKTKELETRMGYYDRNEPGEQVQELHSILGTEFSDLGDELNKYYARYFKDRESVVASYAQYSAVINEIETKRDNLKQEILQLQQQLSSEIEKYNSDVNQANLEIMALEAERSTVDTTNVYAVIAYNNKRAYLISKINALEIRQQAILSKQDLYNSKINQYNEIVLTGNKITKDLNSSIEDLPDVKS